MGFLVSAIVGWKVRPSRTKWRGEDNNGVLLAYRASLETLCSIVCRGNSGTYGTVGQTTCSRFDLPLGICRVEVQFHHIENVDNMRSIVLKLR